MKHLPIFLVLVIILGITRGQVQDDCSDEDIVHCLNSFLDQNGDGMANSTEIDYFMMHNDCALNFQKSWGRDLINDCDSNKNGAFDMGDTEMWYSCFRVIQWHAGMCADCKLCNNTRAN